MEEQRSGEQVPSPGPVQEQDAQRNLTATIIETAVALKLVDQVVPDAYGVVKGAAKKVMDKVSADRAPAAKDQDPGPAAHEER